ncbi:hypothetical protein BDW68DRAFT_192069 [Aspergillus falconensis]
MFSSESDENDSLFEVKEIHTKEEYARLVDVLWAANFKPYNPVFTAVHPVSGHSAADRIRDKAFDTEIRRAAHEKNPPSYLIYANDKETGHVAGGSEWLIFHDNPFPKGPRPIPCTCRFLSQAFFPRQCWFQKVHAGVNAMGADPDYRRRGVVSSRGVRLGASCMSNAGIGVCEEWSRLVSPRGEWTEKVASGPWAVTKETCS